HGDADQVLRLRFFMRAGRCPSHAGVIGFSESPLHRQAPPQEIAPMIRTALVFSLAALLNSSFALQLVADEPAAASSAETPRATIDGTGLGWRSLGEADFVNVNCNPDTWSWKDGEAHC